MYLLDSDIVIYAADPAYPGLAEFISDRPTAFSMVTMVETLGYHKLTEEHRNVFETYFINSTALPVTDAVIDRAIGLRQARKMSLGDALIAATALLSGRTLVTHNVEDFASIPGLTLLDPLGRAAVERDASAILAGGWHRSALSDGGAWLANGGWRGRCHGRRG
jgi:predicted nucleic acid-binding protein